MSKTAHGVSRKKRVKKLLGLAKGARGSRSKHYRRAKETVRRALRYSYRDRKTRKREFRSLWIIRINAAARARGMKYSQFMGALKKNNIELSRDVLSRMAIEDPQAFDKLIEQVKIN